ncbi:hypothetical protein [Flavobacterium sp. RS13.1]|uniref:hypothetical protein n=1 Tax=Flavobacterium sp. RS13.1 TaxID=3400345 RepID=UPI003AAE54F0
MRALPVWFYLKPYSKEGFCDIVENSILLALHFGNALIEEGEFELLTPIRFNNLCFTLKGDYNQENFTQFLTKFNNPGKVFMIPTVYQNKKGIRASFVNCRTTENDVKIVIQEMREVVSEF